MFHQINHGKLGITLNAKDPRAVNLLKRLAAESDVVVENMSPGAMDRAGLGYDALRAVNPRLVYLSMAAAGQFGPLAQMRTYAPVMSSFVGLESLVGYRHEPPIGSLNFAIGDPNATVHGMVGLMAALLQARRTGRGCYIDLSQIEAMLATLGPYVLAAQVAGRQPAPLGNGHPDWAPHGIFPAQGTDRWLAIAVADDGQWSALAALAGLHDSRFATSASRAAHRDELDAKLRAWTATFARDDLVARLRAAGIASSPVLDIHEQWNDAHYAARGVKARVPIPYYGDEDLFKAPWRFSDFAPVIDRSGPTLGQHNHEVFCGLLGMTEAEVAQLTAEGVIA
jgi:crotonobetainyl-CoA:carnitine CoA-transferase CaiB-like acyl-CoA transferase